MAVTVPFFMDNRVSELIAGVNIITKIGVEHFYYSTEFKRVRKNVSDFGRFCQLEHAE